MSTPSAEREHGEIEKKLQKIAVLCSISDGKCKWGHVETFKQIAKLAEEASRAASSGRTGAREFYIDESSNGEQYFIDGNLVSQKEFTKRRHKECVHVGGKAQFYEFCQNCGLQFRVGQGSAGAGDEIMSELTEKDLEPLLAVIKDWMISESGPIRMKFSHPKLQVSVTILGYKKIILERKFADTPSRLREEEGKS